jgi:hypothetical protein
MLVKIKNLIVKCGESEKRHADLRLEQQTNKKYRKLKVCNRKLGLRI